LATGSLANMRQCLRLVGFMGASDLFRDEDSLPTRKFVLNQREQKLKTFYELKLASALKEAVDRVLDDSVEEIPPLQAREWQTLKAAAEKVLRRPKGVLETPELELPTDEFIGYEVAARPSAPRSGHRARINGPYIASV